MLPTNYSFTNQYIYIYIYICIYIYFFFIIQCVKPCAIPYPHQPPTRGDNTVSVAQGGTPTPGDTKQLLPSDRVLRELYINGQHHHTRQSLSETSRQIHLPRK